MSTTFMQSDCSAYLGNASGWCDVGRSVLALEQPGYGLDGCRGGGGCLPETMSAAGVRNGESRTLRGRGTSVWVVTACGG